MTGWECVHVAILAIVHRKRKVGCLHSSTYGGLVVCTPSLDCLLSWSVFVIRRREPGCPPAPCRGTSPLWRARWGWTRASPVCPTPKASTTPSSTPTSALWWAPQFNNLSEKTKQCFYHTVLWKMLKLNNFVVRHEVAESLHAVVCIDVCRKLNASKE